MCVCVCVSVYAQSAIPPLPPPAAAVRRSNAHLELHLGDLGVVAEREQEVLHLLNLG